jgi:hypothetical protein
MRMMIEEGRKGEDTRALPTVLKDHEQTTEEYPAGLRRFFCFFMRARALLRYHYQLCYP